MDIDKFINLRKHFEETDHFTDAEFERLITYLTPVTLKKKEFFTLQGSLFCYFAFVNSSLIRYNPGF